MRRMSSTKEISNDTNSCEMHLYENYYSIECKRRWFSFCRTKLALNGTFLIQINDVQAGWYFLNVD